MRSIFSRSLDPTGWRELARELAGRFDADLFLSGPGFPGEAMGYAGIGLAGEFVARTPGDLNQLPAFAFSQNPDGPEPVFGYLGYAAGMILRGVPNRKSSDFPLAHLKKYGVVVRHDASSSILEILAREDWVGHAAASFITAFAPSDSPSPLSVHRPAPLPAQIDASMTAEEYRACVTEVLERIREGYAYQLNLSVMFSASMSLKQLAERFFHLFSTRPAPFYAWFGSGPHTVLSTSPELFLRVRDGEIVSEPIKGTLKFDPSAVNPGQELPDALVRKLTESPKESAELSMIVDLIRNDVSIRSEYGSVRVADHKSVFAVDNLLQMRTTVRGTLRQDATCLDLLLDASPGGSVTGCPKASSMAIIEELEPHARDMYCGSLFIIHDQRNMDSCVAIRTGLHDSRVNRFRFHAGSGIVVDSDPESEYLETMAKAEKFTALFIR